MIGLRSSWKLFSMMCLFNLISLNKIKIVYSLSDFRISAYRFDKFLNHFVPNNTLFSIPKDTSCKISYFFYKVLFSSTGITNLIKVLPLHTHTIYTYIHMVVEKKCKKGLRSNVALRFLLKPKCQVSRRNNSAISRCVRFTEKL